jgi:hypothetical protein
MLQPFANSQAVSGVATDDMIEPIIKSMAHRTFVTSLLIVACLTCADMPLRLSASCQMQGPTCEELAKADLVFIADVLEATFVPRTNDQGTPYPEGTANYRFNVLEGFKGVKAGEFRAPFYYGGGKDLDQFGAGQRVLIFANRAVTGIYGSVCGRSRPISQKEWFAPILAELDRCLKKP